MTKHLPPLETLFKALADTTRLRIVGLLLAGEVCVCHIHESLGIPQSKASRHLAYLRRAGLVVGRRDGLWVHYRLAESSEPVLQGILSSVQHALTHVNEVHRDLTRLHKTTGCGVPALTPPSPSCCGNHRPNSRDVDTRRLVSHA